jgi:hypothetical protein
MPEVASAHSKFALNSRIDISALTAARAHFFRDWPVNEAARTYQPKLCSIWSEVWLRLLIIGKRARILPVRGTRQNATVWWSDGEHHALLMDVRTGEVDNGAHGCLLPFWFGDGEEMFGSV